MIFGECPTLHLPHLGTLKILHQVFLRIQERQKPAKLTILHLENVPLSDICPILGTASTKLLNKKDVAVTFQKISVPFTHYSNLIRCVPLSARVPLNELTDRVQNQ